MSQSPLARRSRKSLSAFSRVPSTLSRSHSSRDLEESPSPSPSPAPTSSASSPSPPKSPEQNAFLTPTKDTPSRRKSRRWDITDHAPRTPTRIVYSPYQTPPAPISKSSSVPFDMAANLREVKMAEERNSRRSSLGVESSPTEKRKRFVRKKALWQRIAEWPGSIAELAVLGFPTSIEDMLPPARFANPIALFLYVVQWLLLAPLRAAPTDTPIIRSGHYRSGVDDRWGRYEEETKASRRGLAGTRMALLATVLLFALSMANAVWLFTRHRTYDLLTRTAQDVIQSPNASPVPAPRMSDSGTQTGSPDESDAKEGNTPVTSVEKYSRMVARLVWLLAKWTAFSVMSAFGARPPAASTGFRSADKIQSLWVWEPPAFNLAFFCAFIPSAPIVAYFLTTSHPFITPLLHASVAFALSHLAASFSQLVKDRQILSAEVMREYDQRFVYKRLFTTRVDRGVGTSDPS